MPADDIFALLDRPVWVVTAADGPRRGGLLATFVMQASIDSERPTIMVGLGTGHFTTELVLASKALAAHLLAPSQVEVALNFALGSGRNRDKLAELAVRTEQSGAPVLSESLAWFDCQVFHSLNTGDRVYVWADMLAAGGCGKEAPLTERQLIAHASPEVRQKLKADREKDIAAQRPAFDAWRASLRSIR